MSAYEIVRMVAAAAAGWAIFVLAIAVLYHADVRQNRWATFAGWVATVPASLWLAMGPALVREPPEPFVVVLSITLAIVGWQQLQGLCNPASARTRIISFVRHDDTVPMTPRQDVCTPH